MGGVWKSVVFILLLATVEGNWYKIIKKSDTIQQDTSVKEILLKGEVITGEQSTLKNGEYMTKRTGKSGDSLIIGSYSLPLHWKYSTETYFECGLVNNDENIYKQIYEPEIYKRTSDSYEMSQDEEKQSQAVSENFIHIKMEIWKCTKFQAKISSTYAEFYFIRNEFISFKEIRDIKYVSGVEVSLIDYASDERRVKVVETKYFYPMDYTHCREIFEKASARDFKLLLKEHHVPQNPLPKIGGLAFEVKYPNEKNLLSYEIESSVDGANLRLGPYLNMDASQTANTVITAECQSLLGVNPALRRPEVFKIFEQSSQNSAQNEGRSIYAKLSDKEFEDLFIITRRKFWKCTPTSNGEDTSTSFHRVMHEVVGKKPIKKVISGFGIQEIVSVQMPDQQQAKTVRFTIVDNFYMHDLSRITNPVSLTYKEEKRLTATILSGAKEIIDVDFRLIHPSVVFRTLIGDQGYDLRVGYEQKFGYEINTSKTGIIPCTKTDYSDEFETNFMIIMKTGDKFHRTSDVLVETNGFYKYLSKNAWKCFGTKKNGGRKPDRKYEFMRVVNELQVLVKVNEIETFDGVEIFYDGSDVKLVETKYYWFSHEDKKYLELQLGTKIELKVSEGSYNSAKAENSPTKMPRTQLVSKTNDEIVRWADHNSNTKHALKFKGDSRMQSLQLVETGLNTIQFTYNTQPTTGGVTAGEVQTNIYICEPKKNPEHRPLASYDVYSRDNSKIYHQTDFGENEYFTDVNFEVQVCVQMIYNQESNTNGEVKQIYRVVSEQTLKDEKVTAISTVSYDEVLHDVGWFETGSNGNQYKLKLKSFRYYDYDPRTSKLILHKVSDDETLLPKPVAQPIAGWKSGSMTVDNMDQKRREIQVPTRSNYLERLHETEVPQNYAESGVNRVSLIIGSKWTKVFGSYEMEMNCIFQDNTGKEDFPFIKYNTEMKNRDGSSVESRHYFVRSEWYQEVWKCTPPTGSTASYTDEVYRIVNEHEIESDKLNSLNFLYNYDGVTIFRNTRMINGEKHAIIRVKEIKYIYGESVVKFEGVIKLIKSNPSGTEHKTELAEANSPHRYLSIHRRDIMLPKENVVFQSFVVNPYWRNNENPGLKRVYEFGENTQKEIKQGQLFYMECFFKGKLRMYWNLMTKASLYQTINNGGGTDRLSFNNEDPDMRLAFSLGDFDQQIWHCEMEIKYKTYLKYYRVENEFKINFKTEKIQGNVLIYHYEGVTVTRDGVVREVKYYNTELKPIRYDGVVCFIINYVGDQVGYHLDDKSGREVYYYLDRPMLKFKSVNGFGKGRPVQFGEPAESDGTLEVVQPIPNKPMTCKTYSGGLGDIRTWTATKLFTTQQSLSNEPSNWIRIILGMGDSEFYTYKSSRNIWECEREQDGQLFLRVENIHVPSYRLYPMDTLFVADGLTLETIILPDQSKNFLITEVKYFKQERNGKNELSSLVPVKFDGEVLLVVKKPSTIMKRLYPSSSDYELAGSDTNGKYWSMDALKTQFVKICNLHTIEQYLQDKKQTTSTRSAKDAAEGKKSPTNRRASIEDSVAAVTRAVTAAVAGFRTEAGIKETPAVIYKEKGKVYAIALGGTGYRIIHIAADDWTQDADEEGYFCFQDIWSPKDRLRFIPKVIVRIDDFNYELNGEALLKLSNVEQEVHLCFSKHKESRVPILTRVTTTLEIDADGINAVSYSGSARVDIVEPNAQNKIAKRTVKVTIDTFIEEDSSTIYKSDTKNTKYETTLSKSILDKLANIITPK